MKLSIFGLGYVGSVSAACFARDGQEVIGVDVNPLKVQIINAGRSPIVEPQLNELILEAVKAGRLTQAQETRILADLDQRISDFVNGKLLRRHEGFGFGGPGRPGRGDGGPPAAFLGPAA